jgi:hypothetical protein
MLEEARDRKFLGEPRFGDDVLLARRRRDQAVRQRFIDGGDDRRLQCLGSCPDSGCEARQ